MILYKSQALFNAFGECWWLLVMATNSQHIPQLFAIVEPTLYKQIHFYTPLLMIYLIMNFKVANFLKTDCAYRKTAPI